MSNLASFQSAKTNYQCLIARNKKTCSVPLLQLTLDIHKERTDVGESHHSRITVSS